VPPDHVVVRRGAVQVLFPARAARIVDAYAKNRRCDAALLERAHGRTMADLLRFAKSKAGQADGA
jgi:hypothetical protein